MKTHLHKKIHEISESFHKGDLSLADYRELRRKELDRLQEQSMPGKRPKRKLFSSFIVKRVFLATFSAICLILMTVIVAKFVL
tara:strand:+ start:446 stop:694 length:249 start_codon:yes stop_codon:yes gene_type:complete